jgi:hypothetical protein
VELSVYWETDEVGFYTGELRLSTATEGVEDIVIQLRAEAVPMGTLPDPDQPKFSLSTHSMTFNISPDNNYSDLQIFTFSATNLQKTLYCKWAHTSSVLFRYEYENACMEILAGDNEVPFNGTAQFPVGYDYEDEEVYVAISNVFSTGTYETRLHFYSYEKDSKEELAIDEYVTIRTTITTSSTPTDLNDVVNESEVGASKILRDGQLLILRNGLIYSVDGSIIL